jgi:hypothetical protein
MSENFSAEIIFSMQQGTRSPKGHSYLGTDPQTSSKRLTDSLERQQATELLQDCKEEIILPLLGEDGHLEVEVAGLEIMNDDQVSQGTDARIDFLSAEREGNTDVLRPILNFAPRWKL